MKGESKKQKTRDRVEAALRSGIYLFKKDMVSYLGFNDEGLSNASDVSYFRVCLVDDGSIKVSGLSGAEILSFEGADRDKFIMDYL